VIKSIETIKSYSNKNADISIIDSVGEWEQIPEKTKDIKNLNVIGAAFSSKTNEMIEDDLIDSFRFFKLNEKNFIVFFENKKGTWRHHNINVRDFFMMRYQANKLNTYNNSQNFDSKILSFINKSSPALAQQIIIPYDEIQRLKKNLC
jgi:hypothetical protein